MLRTLRLSGLLFLAGLGGILVAALGGKLVAGYIQDISSPMEDVWPFYAALAYAAFATARTITFITDKDS